MPPSSLWQALDQAGLRFSSLDELIAAVSEAHLDLVRKRKLYFLSDYSATISDQQRQELIYFLNAPRCTLFAPPQLAMVVPADGSLPLTTTTTAAAAAAAASSSSSSSSSSGASAGSAGSTAAGGTKLPLISNIGVAGGGADQHQPQQQSQQQQQPQLQSQSQVVRLGGGVRCSLEELDLLLMEGRGLFATKQHLTRLQELGCKVASMSDLIVLVRGQHLQMKKDILSYLTSPECALFHPGLVSYVT